MSASIRWLWVIRVSCAQAVDKYLIFPVGKLVIPLSDRRFDRKHLLPALLPHLIPSGRYKGIYDRELVSVVCGDKLFLMGRC